VLYHAVITEATKGTVGSLSFSAAGPLEGVDEGNEYFGILFRTLEPGREGPKLAFSDFSPSELGTAAQACRVRSTPYFVYDGTQVIIPFDSDATRILGGEWLAPAGSSALRLGDLPIMQVEIDARHVDLVDWTLVREEVRKALDSENDLP
jgi:hypothetical protein